MEKKLENLIHNTWIDKLNDKEKHIFWNNYCEIEKKRNKQDIIFPIEDENGGIYYALNKTPLDKVKVLIIGQDPYPNEDQAHGLAFSIKSGEIPENSCLKNIFEKINITHTSGNLTSWAEKGVLLLNMALTFSEKETLSDRIKYWHCVIEIIIDKLIKRKKPLHIILWGKKANEMKLFPLDKDEEYEENEIYIIRSSHPSNKGNAKNRQLKNGINSFNEQNFDILKNILENKN